MTKQTTKQQDARHQAVKDMKEDGLIKSSGKDTKKSKFNKLNYYF